MTDAPLPVYLESAPRLANWLGVQEVMLVREDLLPQAGGKKRRSLAAFAAEIRPGQEINILSYAGSHTAFTLARLLPGNQIRLFGMNYDGGPYQNAMVRRLSTYENVEQQNGSMIRVTLRFWYRKLRARPNEIFLGIGGRTGQKDRSSPGILKVTAQLPGFHHLMAVASGELFREVRQHTPAVTGILTQPLLIRWFKKMELPQTCGVIKPSLEERMRVMVQIADIYGVLWDPVFMGSVFTHLRRAKTLPPKLCIWITCPTGIEWAY